MIIRSKAPLRISFAGGGTDISPYPEERGGVVLCTTIDRYAISSLQTSEDRHLSVHSLDYDLQARYNMDEEEKLSYDGEMDLVKAVVNSMCEDKSAGLDFFMHSDAPPGTGLGSSSTMVVSLIGAVKHWQRQPLTDYEIAELAYHIERKELAIAGGMQDQYAAVFGGFNLIEFHDNAVIVNPLRVTDEILNELQYNLLMVYTGKSRLSGNIITTQVDNYKRGEEEVIDALDELKAITYEVKNALLTGRLDDFGALLHEGWKNKKKVAAQITTSNIDELYSLAREHGALGGKILGAGGGGHLLIYCPFQKKHIIAEHLERAGAEVVNFAFEQRGLQTWEV